MNGKRSVLWAGGVMGWFVGVCALLVPGNAARVRPGPAAAVRPAEAAWPPTEELLPPPAPTVPRDPERIENPAAAADPLGDLDTRDVESCRRALYKLRKSTDPAVLRAGAERLLASGEAWLQVHAVALLAQLGDAARLADLVAPAWSPLVRRSAIDALAKMPGETAGVLRTALEDGDGFVRAKAACALRERGEPGPADRMADDARRTMRGAEPRSKAAAAWILGALADREAVPLLIAALGDAEGRVRAAAAAALGAIKDVSAAEALRGMEGDSDPEVRRAARAAAIALRR